ncbi:MAG: hypothetical protein JWP52_936 [Rhizobacter sp.]|nr:hypothetical protein [Rhizobacter sp.]
MSVGGKPSPQYGDFSPFTYEFKEKHKFQFQFPEPPKNKAENLPSSPCGQAPIWSSSTGQSPGGTHSSVRNKSPANQGADGRSPSPPLTHHPMSAARLRTPDDSRSLQRAATAAIRATPTSGSSNRQILFINPRKFFYDRMWDFKSELQKRDGDSYRLRSAKKFQEQFGITRENVHLLENAFEAARPTMRYDADKDGLRLHAKFKLATDSGSGRVRMTIGPTDQTNPRCATYKILSMTPAESTAPGHQGR